MRFNLHYQGASRNPLGNVRVIGEISGGRGVEPKHAMRTIDTYGLTLILAGSGDYQGPGAYRTDLVPGSLILTYPNRPHLFGPARGQTWHEIFAIFEGPLFDLLVERDVLNPARLVLQTGNPAVLSEELRNLARSEDSIGVVGGLAQWLQRVSESAGPQAANDGASNWIHRATALLESNLDEDLPMASIADALEIGYETFRKEFARYTGTSPMKYRMRRRLSLAAGLLHHTGLPVSEISLRLGYSDAFTFSKAFKRQYRLSPSAFRRHPR